MKGKGEAKARIALCTYSVLLANYLLKDEKKRFRGLTRTFRPQGNFVLDTALLIKNGKKNDTQHLRLWYFIKTTLTFWGIRLSGVCDKLDRCNASSKCVNYVKVEDHQLTSAMKL